MPGPGGISAHSPRTSSGEWWPSRGHSRRGTGEEDNFPHNNTAWKMSACGISLSSAGARTGSRTGYRSSTPCPTYSQIPVHYPLHRQ